jgi:PAS domain S-box-containing protein
MRSQPSNRRVVLPVAVGYLALGIVGLTLAIPPGYASPVFPAAGLALACLLHLGWRSLPGVWLGSAVLNLSHAALGGTLTPATAALAALIATGASAQAAAGRILVLRWQGSAWKEMEREQDAFSFLFLGGVLACLVSASVSVPGLLAVGVIDRAEFLFTWWNWYVGDALGVLVFAPLSLCFLSRADRLWLERRQRIVGPVLVALGLVVLAFHSAARWEADAERARLHDDGTAVARRIGDRLITHREVLASLRNFMEATPGVTFAQFDQFTRLTLHENRDISALSFNDRLDDAQRTGFEEAMGRLSPLGAYQITERDPERRLVRAGRRAGYVAVRYIVPLAGNQPAVGFDILSEPVRRKAIEQVVASSDMVVTAPVLLVQERQERAGVLELLPVSTVPSQESPEVPRIAGFAVAVIKLDEMVEIATKGSVPEGLAFELTDPQAPDGRGLLHRSAAWSAEVSRADRAGSAWSTPLRAGDREWLLSVAITEGHRQAHRPWAAWAVGVVGLIFAALFQVLMLATTGRAAIIERKSEALRASEERYQRLFDESPLPMWVYEAESLRFLMVNDRAVAHYGWPRPEFLRMGLPDILPPGDGPGAVAGHALREIHECRHVRSDGSAIDVVVRSSPASYGEVDARLEVVQDVTQERLIQARLLLADKVFENSGSAIAVTDPEARAVSVNPAFSRVTGYEAGEVVGQNLRILNSGRHPPEFFQGMWRSLLEEHQWQGELWNRRKSGEVYLEWLTIKAVRDPVGVTTHYVASFIDITERRALEEKLATASRLAAMGTLVAGVAHEVNNPLAGTMGAQGTALENVRDLRARLASAGAVDPARVAAELGELQEILGDAQAGTERIARIVKDLTLLGRRDVQRGRVHLADVVDEAMRWLPASVPGAAAIVVENVGPPDVEVSAGQLAQVLINLITNAAKAIPSGRPGRVIVRLGPGEEGRARLEVADNGAGMERDVLERVFDPFFTTRKVGEGTGLGLPICHSIITAHGGTITVGSVPGEGTTFRIELPAAR